MTRFDKFQELYGKLLNGNRTATTVFNDGSSLLEALFNSDPKTQRLM